jgi:uncharacterized protein involved in type VI secretion and phage assembly
VSNDQLLRTLLSPSDSEERFFGVVVGVVTNNRDPEGMHRVKVKFPWLHLDHESNWARVVAPMAGAGRGAYFLPEAGDEVLLAFEHGSLEHPYVIGTLWNGKDSPPESNGNGKNDNRAIKSRSGHVIRLGDAAGDERIEIIDKTGSNRVVIKSSNNSISIEAQGDIAIKSSTGKVTISGIGVEITSTTDVKIRAQTSVDVSATGQVNVKGALVNIN